MDDIIIIILTLIFILASVIGQKKKPVKNIEPPLPRAEDDLWTLPGEHITVTTARTAEEGAMQPSDRKLFPGETQLISEKETDSYGTKSDLKTAQELKHPDIKNKFSLKKAVIYSEILNRKYL
jgi:hypothetical protein